MRGSKQIFDRSKVMAITNRPIAFAQGGLRQRHLLAPAISSNEAGARSNWVCPVMALGATCWSWLGYVRAARSAARNRRGSLVALDSNQSLTLRSAQDLTRSGSFGGLRC